jgi:hypothetical protein
MVMDVAVTKGMFICILSCQSMELRACEWCSIIFIIPALIWFKLDRAIQGPEIMIEGPRSVLREHKLSAGLSDFAVNFADRKKRMKTRVRHMRARDKVEG